MKMTVNNSDDYKALEKMVETDCVSNILYTLSEIYCNKSNEAMLNNKKMGNYYIKVCHNIEMVAKQFDD